MVLLTINLLLGLLLSTNYNAARQCIGAATLYAFSLVVVTSYFRPRLGYRPCKRLHYTADPNEECPISSMAKRCLWKGAA